MPIISEKIGVGTVHFNKDSLFKGNKFVFISSQLILRIMIGTNFLWNAFSFKIRINSNKLINDRLIVKSKDANNETTLTFKTVLST